jgi:hypothetical protein
MLCRVTRKCCAQFTPSLWRVVRGVVWWW